MSVQRAGCGVRVVAVAAAADFEFDRVQPFDSAEEAGAYFDRLHRVYCSVVAAELTGAERMAYKAARASYVYCSLWQWRNRETLEPLQIQQG